VERYILDACALLAFFNDEEGAEIVEGLFQKTENMEISVCMSIINLLEVYYDRLRTRNDGEIKNFREFTATVPIEFLNSISDFVFHEAARLKASYKMSLADAIGLAVAEELSGQFVASDHSELEEVERHEKIPFLRLPAKPKKP
jgi:predicted nucleic acid-binding protein